METNNKTQMMDDFSKLNSKEKNLYSIKKKKGSEELLTFIQEFAKNQQFFTHLGWKNVSG